MFFYNAFVIPSDVNYEVRKVYVEAAERGLGYYSLNQSNGEIEFNWKAPCTDGPERVE